MSDFTVSPLGWSNRRKLAEVNSYSNADAERQAIRAERARIYAEQEEADRLALEAQTAALQAAECRCVACGGTGSVPVVRAAEMLTAWHSFKFHGYTVSNNEVAALAAVARGDAIPPGCVRPTFSYGMIPPAPSPRPETVEVVAPVVEPNANPVKPARIVAPIEDTTGMLTNDGFLIEV